MIRNIGRLNPSKTVLLLCDLQEKFAPSIQYFTEIVQTSSRVFDICKHLDVPYLVTEHYPKGKKLIFYIRHELKPLLAFQRSWTNSTTAKRQN